MSSRKSPAEAQPSEEKKVLTDLFSRTISYLRLSVTDRCNLHCIYCRPAEAEEKKLKQRDILTYEELLRVIQAAVALGMSKLRLTGGEPLMRRDLIRFIEQVARLGSLNDIRITTNGILLKAHAEQLRSAGIRSINISLDTLHPQRFARITGLDCFQQVWQGIQKAQELDFAAVKLNVVVMRGINDDELLDFARLSLDRALQIRFIEFMPLGKDSRWHEDSYISSREIQSRLAPLGDLLPLPRHASDGPAMMFQLGAEAKGQLGFISPLSHHFCDRCNRLRLTSEGKLRACLLHDAELDLRSLLRQGCSDADIQNALLTTVRNKPQGHGLTERLQQQEGGCHGRMSRIGG
jgi:cyclic pyranopterin phosphate synthase